MITALQQIMEHLMTDGKECSILTFGKIDGVGRTPPASHGSIWRLKRVARNLKPGDAMPVPGETGAGQIGGPEGI